MTIRRIKADSATEDGDYIRIERRSRRGLWFLLGAFSGILICIMYFDLGFVYPDQDLVMLLVVIVSALVGFLSDDGKVVRRVPKIDLVEIKKYTWPHRVTVVFDDERSMRGRRVGEKAVK